MVLRNVAACVVVGLPGGGRPLLDDWVGASSGGGQKRAQLRRGGLWLWWGSKSSEHMVVWVDGWRGEVE